MKFAYWVVELEKGTHLGEPGNSHTLPASRKTIVVARDRNKAVKAVADTYGARVAPKGWNIGENYDWDELVRHQPQLQEATDLTTLMERLARNVGSVRLETLVTSIEDGHVEMIRVEASEGTKVRVVRHALTGVKNEANDLAYNIQSLF